MITMSTSSLAADALRDYLSKHNKTQAKFAMFELGVSETCLQNWLAGRGKPSLENALKIEKLTGIKIGGWLQAS